MPTDLDSFPDIFEHAVEQATEAGKEAMLKFLADRASANLEKQPSQVPPGRSAHP